MHADIGDVGGLDAVKCVGLDFGAVDVMIGSDSVAVCEINTAPTLGGEYSDGKYGAYFAWLDRGERIHWDYTAFAKAKSLFWKRNQLEG